jgi:type IV pilus assembly protein PilA
MNAPQVPGAGPQPQPPQQPPKTSKLAIIALVISCLVFLPLVPIIGAILGIIALTRFSGRPHLKGRGAAIAAIPIGFVVAFFFQGILAAVAIPAFIKYIRKAKTVEATEGLDKIHYGARAFVQADRFDPSGNPLPKGFPQGQTGWVPPTPCCDQGVKCSPNPSLWQGSPWRELRFQVADPHYFQWRYRGGGSTFVAEAQADLDCDGRFSSYQIMGTLNSDGQVEIRGPIIRDEIE